MYLYGEDLRQEYVLNDSGLIYRGSYNRIRPSVWKFAQFERDVLECTLYLAASVGRLSPPSRADPVKTVRALSAAVRAPPPRALKKHEKQTAKTEPCEFPRAVK